MGERGLSTRLDRVLFKPTEARLGSPGSEIVLRVPDEATIGQDSDAKITFALFDGPGLVAFIGWERAADPGAR